MRLILDGLEQSNVIVYVTCEQFRTVTIEGRTLWVVARAGARYLRVRIDCQVPVQRLVRILAHELEHAGEVAGVTGVIDDSGFARLFPTIGFRTCDPSDAIRDCRSRTGRRSCA